MTAYDYRPRLGGVATFAHELLRASARDPDVEIRLVARASDGDSQFDANSGVDTVRVKLPSSTALASLVLAWHLRREMRDFEPHATVHLLWLPEGLASFIVRKILRTGRKVPYFVITHGVELMESRRNFKKRLRGSLAFVKRAVLRAAAGVIANSRYTADLAASAGAAPSKIFVIHPGVDPSRFEPGPKPAALARAFHLEGKKVLLSVSRLTPHKGIDTMVRAMKHVVRRHPNAIYLIGGKGPDYARLRRLVRALELSSQVRFVGKIPEARIGEYYNLADLFCLLSREEKDTPSVEGFGIVFLEASACAKPSLAGASGGIPDAVENGVTGWLVPPTDPKRVADVICDLLDHPERLEQAGRAAQERMLGGFTWQHSARAFLREIQHRVDR